MKTKHFVACDLGAESGRVIIGHLAGGKISLEEAHRFATGPTVVQGTLRWNLLKFFDEIQTGLKKARAKVGALDGISIDAWGVDYSLRGEREPMLGLPFHYRDGRTDDSFPQFVEHAGKKLIFEQTGIQFMQINTLYQLYDDVLHRPKLLELAASFLPIADYLQFLLTGNPVAELSIASTTQIFNPVTRDWSKPLIDKLGLPRSFFPAVVKPGTPLGQLSSHLSEETGLTNCPVYATCSHDTGAAVAAVPAKGEDWAFISSGTWSLLGIETNLPIINELSLSANFTNELGFAGNVRFLKNILGLWILQEIRRELNLRGNDLDYATLNAKAAESAPLRSIINPNQDEFLKPGRMIEKVQEFCQRTGQKRPEDPGALARCTLESLALSYASQIDEIERISGRQIRAIHIVGGGSRSRLLNQFTADASGRMVLGGPVEATALGNLLVQASACGDLSSQDDIREVVRNSFSIEEFQPKDEEPWIAAKNLYKKIQA